MVDDAQGWQGLAAYGRPAPWARSVRHDRGIMRESQRATVLGPDELDEELH
jgi:hypothetical protein